MVSAALIVRLRSPRTRSRCRAIPRLPGQRDRLIAQREAALAIRRPCQLRGEHGCEQRAVAQVRRLSQVPWLRKAGRFAVRRLRR